MFLCVNATGWFGAKRKGRSNILTLRIGATVLGRGAPEQVEPKVDDCLNILVPQSAGIAYG